MTWMFLTYPPISVYTAIDAQRIVDVRNCFDIKVSLSVWPSCIFHQPFYCTIDDSEVKGKTIVWGARVFLSINFVIYTFKV